MRTNVISLSIITTILSIHIFVTDVDSKLYLHHLDHVSSFEPQMNSICKGRVVKTTVKAITNNNFGYINL